MEITLNLPPEKKAELERHAAAAGTDLTSFILDAVQDRVEEQNGSTALALPYEQWTREFHAWIASQPSRNPHFDDSRDSIYD
jgi:uncharacterized protein (DUF1778 family)